MPGDDELIDAYEEELSAPPPRRGSGRGFWLVVGSIGLACVLLLVEIFANRPIANDIGRAQHALRVAESGAARVYTETGSYAGADAAGLTAARFDGGELTYVDATTTSSGTDSVSVGITADGEWTAAVQVRPGACFYLRLIPGAKDPKYGVGTDCTAIQARASSDDRW
jgi:hypothetical protein